MALDTLQEWMSAINPACPWRGPMVDPSVAAGINTYAAEVYLFSGVFEGSGGGASTPIGFFPHVYFANRYFPDRYFPGTGGVSAAGQACAHASDVALYAAAVADVALYSAISTVQVC